MNPNQAHDQELIRRGTPEGRLKYIRELEAELVRLRARLERRESVAPMAEDEIARMCPSRLSTVGEMRGWVVGYAAGREDVLTALRAKIRALEAWVQPPEPGARHAAVWVDDITAWCRDALTGGGARKFE